LPLLDAGELWKRVGGDADFLNETCEMFAEDYPPLVAKVDAALSGNDAAAAAAAAHTLKGMISNFCAPRAHAAAAALEEAARGGDLTKASDLLPEVSAQLTTLAGALAALPR
jgi:HPt (histidine-containing phosphotransfer) domain-containing protein